MEITGTSDAWLKVYARKTAYVVVAPPSFVSVHTSTQHANVEEPSETLIEWILDAIRKCEWKKEALCGVPVFSAEFAMDAVMDKELFGPLYALAREKFLLTGEL